MTDSSQEEKQNFLRETILEKGYNTEQFVNFLIDKKGENGADVAVWTMNDLKIVVKEFIKLNGGSVEEEEPPKPEVKQETKTAKKISMFDILNDAKPRTQPQPQVQQTKKETSTPQVKVEPQKPKTQIQPQTQQNVEQKKIEENKANTVAFLGNESDYGVIIPETIQCKKCEITDIGKKEGINIVLSEPLKKEGGFLKKDYMTYLISTYPVSYKVRRRYTDFGWLRTALQTNFPTNLIPPIPKRNRFGVDPFAESFVSKRQRGLEKFLNYLTKDPIIKTSQLFYDFLYIGAEVDFNSKKKVYQNTKTITDAKEFKTIDGKGAVSITGEKEGYLENIRDYILINNNLFKKLNMSFKSLFDEMNTVINRMEEISNMWNQIYKASEKYFDNNTSCECYKQMSNLFKTWSVTLKENNNIINVDIREHFKFIRKNFASLKELITTVDTHKYNYQKNVKNLMSKKEDYFKRGDPTKWELDPKKQGDYSLIAKDKKTSIFKMFPKDTSYTINLKEVYGFYINRALSEYERMRNLNGILSKEIVTKNVNKMTEILGKIHSCVGEINSSLDSAALNKTNDQKCQLNRIPLDDSLLR